MKKFAAALAVLAVTGCTVKVENKPTTPTPAAVTSQAVAPIQDTIAPPPTADTGLALAASSIATETSHLQTVIQQTQIDATARDLTAVSGDCQTLRTISVQWTADLASFEAQYPGVLASKGIDPTAAKGAIDKMIVSCQAF